MAQLGYSTGMGAEEFVSWLRADYRKREGLLDQRRRLKGRIRMSLIELWRLSGDGHPFRGTPYGELVERACAVSEYYEDLLERRGSVSVETLASEKLEENIELLTGEYHYVAIAVIQERVWIADEIHRGPVPLFTPLAIAMAQVDRRYRAMKSWLEKNKGSMVWDAARGKYCKRDGMPFAVEW